MGLILAGSKLFTSKKGKAGKKERKQEKTQRADPEAISKNKVTVQSEEIVNENSTLRDK